MHWLILIGHKLSLVFEIYLNLNCKNTCFLTDYKHYSVSKHKSYYAYNFSLFINENISIIIEDFIANENIFLIIKESD